MKTETPPADSGAPVGVRAAHGDDARIVVAVLGLPVLAAAALLPSRTAFALALLAYGLFAIVLLLCASRSGLLRQFGGANGVTCVRATAAAILAGAVADAAAVTGSWWPAGLAAAALSLDGVDGMIARRRGLVSRFGAAFDQEVDAALIMILTLLLWSSGKLGVWILAAGLMRYSFLLAGLIWPVLAAELPKSRRRSAVCAILVAALVVCLLPVVNGTWATGIGAVALFALTLSFAKDVIWLLYNAPEKRIA